jgi:hypothetical protein
MCHAIGGEMVRMTIVAERGEYMGRLKLPNQLRERSFERISVMLQVTIGKVQKVEIPGGNPQPLKG